MFGGKYLKRCNLICLLALLWAAFLASSCSTAPEKKEVKEALTGITPQIKSISLKPGPSGKDLTIELLTSMRVSYTVLKLVQPLRLIVDIDATASQELHPPASLENDIVQSVKIEKIKSEPSATRLIATLLQDVEYEIIEDNNNIILFLSQKKLPEESTNRPLLSPLEEETTGAEKPRLFFSPSKSGLNKIVGVDFFMLEKGKSRITVTTSRKAGYTLERKDIHTLILEIREARIPKELTRYLDSSQFKGVVNKIVPVERAEEGVVDLVIKVREIVPYFLMQVDNEIRLDFNKTSIKPPEKKITAVKSMGEVSKPGGPVAKISTEVAQPSPVKPKKIPEIVPTLANQLYPSKKRYTGAKMTLDFADADIRNILKLIGEISALNIVWGPEVKGTVSMRLKNVPWDQALDLLLEANDLGMRRDGNIIWVTTKAKLAKIEKEEEEKLKAEQDRIKALKAAQKEAKLEEPLFSAYIPVNYAKASDLSKKIDISKRGKINVDDRTNTIYIKDTASHIEEAKKVINLLDTPVKQILIEARIVDATTNFSRDLGLQWSSIERKWQRRTSMAWESEPTNFGTSDDTYFGGSFSSNAPDGWAPNIGLRFARLTNKGLGTITLDATLALAETEGNARIISAPKVITSDGAEAQISQGDVLIIPATEQVESKELKATLSLTVTPKVSANNFITMDVEVTDDRAPSASLKLEKFIKTKLIIQSGDTVVIGGIYKEEKSKDETGIPGLRNIPVLGWLFKARTNVSQKSELLIFLTPTVIAGG